MNNLKKITAFILVLCLAAGLGAAALAVTAQVTDQKVKVDGKAVTVQPYNIDGNNYFKLRDVAALLTGTGSQFEVTYNANTRRMFVSTGKAYTAVGGELKTGSAGAASCEESGWALYVDAKAVKCAVYNIDGNNYFKLRDLGAAANFEVGWDEESRTVLITTAAPPEKPWTPDISFTTTDAGGNAVTDSCFKGYELTMINYWAYWCGYCVQEMPDLQKLADNYAAKGVQVIGVFDGDTEYSNSKNLDVIEDLGITYPCIRYTAAFESYLSTGSMPTTIFVDGEGKVVGQPYVGARSYSAWASIVDSLL